MTRTTFLLAWALLLASSTPAAAQAGPPDGPTALRQGFEEVSGWITKAAAAVPADKYAYRPTKEVRTFGEMVGHIVDGYNYFCGRAAGKKVEWSDAAAKGPTDKATLDGKLKAATAGCAAAHSGAPSPLLLQNYGHTSLHYGNLITYMRLLGLVPPSS
jgi:uncharacterized damage-inducible protein DinB